jgi:CRP/FNR family cyclic AMP-dependent transcriptional regulator
MSSQTSDGENLYFHLSAELRTLAQRGVVQSYPRKVLLIKEGDIGEHLFVLLQGSVKVFSADQGGRELTYARIGAGDYFGEMSLDGGLRSASVVTLEPCTCALLTRSDVRQHLLDEPGFAINLVLQAIRRARASTEVARNMALMDVYTRLVVTLEEHVDDWVAAANPAVDAVAAYPFVIEPVTHQEIASRIGASREMVSRQLNDLEKGGYLQMHTKKIVLLKKLPVRW